jgi:hypothetical protein
MTRTQSFLIYGAAMITAMALALGGFALWEAYGVQIALMSAVAFC